MNYTMEGELLGCDCVTSEAKVNRKSKTPSGVDNLGPGNAIFDGDLSLMRRIDRLSSRIRP